MCIFDNGERERFKGAVHGALGLLALVSCGYNVIVWVRRGEPRHVVNACVYGALVAYECHTVARHARKAV